MGSILAAVLTVLKAIPALEQLVREVLSELDRQRTETRAAASDAELAANLNAIQRAVAAAHPAVTATP
jgi:hypothetical protein